MKKLLIALLLLVPLSSGAEGPGAGEDYGVVEGGGGAGSGAYDLNGGALTFDADDDTYCEAPTDDQIDCYAGGTQVYTLNATSIYLPETWAFQVDQDLSIRRRTSNEMEVRVGGTDVVRFNSGGVFVENGNLEVESGQLDVNGGVVTSSIDGDVLVNSLVYGELVVTNNATATTISASSTWTQVTSGVVTGDVNGTSFASGEITIGTGNGGMYDVTCSLSVDNPGSGTNVYRLGVLVDTGGGDGLKAGCETERSVASGGGALGGIPVSCIADFAASDVVSLGVLNETDTDNATVTYANCKLVRIGS